MTIAEKIVARAAGLPEAHANEIHTVELDYLMSNDGTTHLTIDMYNNLKKPHIADEKSWSGSWATTSPATAPRRQDHPAQVTNFRSWSHHCKHV